MSLATGSNSPTPTFFKKTFPAEITLYEDGSLPIDGSAAESQPLGTLYSLRVRASADAPWTTRASSYRDGAFYDSTDGQKWIQQAFPDGSQVQVVVRTGRVEHASPIVTIRHAQGVTPFTQLTAQLTAGATTVTLGADGTARVPITMVDSGGPAQKDSYVRVSAGRVDADGRRITDDEGTSAEMTTRDGRTSTGTMTVNRPGTWKIDGSYGQYWNEDRTGHFFRMAEVEPVTVVVEPGSSTVGGDIEMPEQLVVGTPATVTGRAPAEAPTGGTTELYADGSLVATQRGKVVSGTVYPSRTANASASGIAR